MPATPRSASVSGERWPVALGGPTMPAAIGPSKTPPVPRARGEGWQRRGRAALRAVSLPRAPRPGRPREPMEVDVTSEPHRVLVRSVRAKSWRSITSFHRPAPSAGSQNPLLVKKAMLYQRATSTPRPTSTASTVISPRSQSHQPHACPRRPPRVALRRASHDSPAPGSRPAL